MPAFQRQVGTLHKPFDDINEPFLLGLVRKGFDDRIDHFFPDQPR